MLGHLKPLSAGCQYHQFYCGICANLRQDFGLPYSLLINNELTLVIHALNPFATWTSQKTACPSKAFLKKNPIQNGILAQKAAHISLVLAWVKAQDWATDSPHFAKKWLAEKLKKQSLKIELSEKFKTTLENYILLIQKNQDFGALRQASAQLSERIFWELAQFTQIPEKIALSLATVFRDSGESILLADHLIDLKSDLKNKQYNGILENVAQNNTNIETEKQQLRTELKNLIKNINHNLRIVQEVNISFVKQMKSALRNINENVEDQEAKKRKKEDNDSVEAQSCTGGICDCEDCDCGSCTNCCDCTNCNCCSCNSCNCGSCSNCNCGDSCCNDCNCCDNCNCCDGCSCSCD